MKIFSGNFPTQAMQRIILIIITFLSSNTLFGQKAAFENLINQIYTERVPENFEYYNLVDSSFVTKFDKYSLERDELSFLQKQFSDFPYKDFIEASKNCSTINWINYDLKNAKIYSIDSVPKFESQIRLIRVVPKKISPVELDSLNRNKKLYEVILPVKKHWSKSRIDKEVQKTWEKYSNSIKAENKTYFSFSTPLIIDNYAIITLNQSGSGASYIYKNTNGVWKQILIFKVHKS